MRIVHRFGLSNSNDPAFAALAAAGVTLERQSGLTSVFELSEDDPRFPAVHEWARRWRAAGPLRTEFSAQERHRSDWLALWGTFFQGYPQPDTDFAYLALTYDLRDYCERCGVGARQIAPFRMRREPKWGSRSVMQLYWVYGEYFVTPKLYQAVLEPAGVESREVLDPSGHPLQTVVQLAVPESVDVDIDGLQWERCGGCDRRKALPVVRGPFPAPVTPPEVALIVRTRQWFGSGAEAGQELLIAQPLFRRLEEARVKGVDFLPVGETLPPLP